MILISIVTLVLALLILILAWRGRVTARGWFCKKCRFDLAGLDLKSSESRCPECGRGVHHESGRRASLRRKSRWGLVAASILLLGGIATLGFWGSGNVSVLIKPLPDWAVVGLTDLGVDEALDELVVRVSKVPVTMSGSKINHVIEDGLTQQADLLVGFDPRWGEVLYVTCVAGQMSEEQLKQYMLNGVGVDVIIRDRVRQGAHKIDALMKITPARMSAINGGYTGYSVEAKWVGDGVVGQRARKSPLSFSPSALVSAPRGWWTTSAPSPIVPTGGALNGEIGSKLLVYTQYDLVLMTSSDGFPASLNIPVQNLEENLVLGRFRIEHEVEIIEPDKPIVPEINDPELARRTCEAMSILPIHLLKVVPNPKQFPRTTVLTMSTQSLNLPANIAIRAYLRLDDGQEIPIGQWVTRGSRGDMMSGIQWAAANANANAKEHAATQAVIDKLFEQGQVDVIFRTDATLAEFSPEIEQVIDLTIIFEDVPIEETDDVSRMSSMSTDDWIKGKCEDMPEPQDPTQP